MSNDFFHFRHFTVRQERCAMKVGTDGTLLGAWARGGRQILDVGTGTGLIALMMAQRFRQACVTGIDIDADAVAQAAENVAASPFAQRISIVRSDVKDMEGLFDAIVSNPPYFVGSLHSPDRQRTMARHADTLPYRLLMQHAHRLLTDEGEMSVVVPTDQQQLMESEAALAGFFKSRQCLVKTAERKPPKRCMMTFAKHPQPLESTTVTLGSDECRRLTSDFYLR